MAVAPRQKSKATKIAWKILGVPQNIAYKRNKEERRINHRLNFDETQRVR
jgi:hypothetical protein